MRTWRLVGYQLYVDDEAVFNLDGFRSPDDEYVYDYMRRMKVLRDFIVHALNQAERLEEAQQAVLRRVRVEQHAANAVGFLQDGWKHGRGFPPR